jgi:hypothetical protein
VKLADLIAYADRQLSPEEEERVEQALYADPRARQALAALLRQRLLLAEVMKAGEEAGSNASPAAAAAQEQRRPEYVDRQTARSRASNAKPAPYPPTASGIARAPYSPSSRRSAVQAVDQTDPARLPRQTWMLAAAVFLLSLLGGVLWWSLWLTPISEQRAERKPTGAMAEYRPSLPSADQSDLSPPKPLPPEPGAEIDPLDYGTGSLDQQLAETQQRQQERLKREAVELDRLIKSQQHALATELPRAKPKRTRDGVVDEEEDPIVTAPMAPEVLADDREPAPIGRVLFVEADAKEAVVLRKAEGAETRAPLTTGTILMAGDRVETQHLNDRACAAVRLDGGATVDLAGETTVQLCSVGHIRLESGRIYACVQRGGSETDEYRPSFLLETSAGRFLTESAQMEVSATPNVSIQPETVAKVDSGRVYLLNDKGRVLGVRGQELRALAQQAPTQSASLSAPIWRGRDLAFENLPCGQANPVVVLNDTPRNCLLEEYALSLAHSGTRRVVALGPGFGGNLMGNFKELSRYMQTLKKRGLRNAPEILLGSSKALQMPASGLAEDTHAESSPAVRRLVDLARQTTPDRPALVICSGSLNEVASAWLLERRCAANLIPVLGYDGDEYKSVGRDPWAAQIVLPRFRCVVLSRTYRPPIDMNLYDQIRNPLWRDLTRQTGCADTALLAAVAMPGLVSEVERSVCISDGNGQFRFEPKANGAIWLVKNIGMDALQQELEETFFGR